MINLNPMAGIAKELMGGLDGLFTSDEERAKAELSLNRQLQQPHILQALANIEEAKHPSVFVSGWRPALGWLCVFILAWTWIVRDVVIIGLMLVDKSEVVQQLPTTDTSTVITLLLCLLGLGGARTIEKLKGVARR
ncbi:MULTISPECIES: 3TM-type holin [Endozoicomonas]|uniref:3TM-type holin n=1 Tax=Endozoicomonas TaxID=305899 RepID=UPI0013D785C6|nr:MULTISPECIES: 3TM-type holin [Endozoicomonas]WBA81559.1 3TM-type holin [Endozoicomonas sp. GU-1]WBA84512.1 3TM-type holin [Endozoicomonas sp. GU-1]